MTDRQITNTNSSHSLESIFLTLAFFSILNISGLILLAIFGLFNYFAISGLFLLTVLGILYSLRGLFTNKTGQSKGFNKKEGLVILAILALVIINGLFHHHLPRGRDDMAYIATAVKISESHSLKFQDELSYPFPPFRQIASDDVFTSRFAPGYSTYLSLFYSIGDLKLLFWANVPLLFLTLLSIFYIGKSLYSRKVGIVACLLFFVFFSTIWFTRRTNSEILFMAVFWSGIWMFLYGWQKNKINWLLASLTCFTLNILVRPEGIIYLLPLVVILPILIIKRKILRHRGKNLFLSVLTGLSILVNIGLFIAYLKLYGSDYYNEVITASMGSLPSLKNVLLVILGISLFLVAYFIKNIYFKVSLLVVMFLGAIFYIIDYHNFLVNYEFTSWSKLEPYYIFQSFNKYLLIPFILLALLGFFFKLFNSKTYVLIILAAPSLVFVISPGIALDHPWFMRRFISVLIPLIFILFSVVLYRFTRQNSKYFYYFSVIFFLINFSVSLPILGFQENQGVEKQLQSLADKFDEDDVIFMEPDWQWQQWAYALHYVYGLRVVPRLDNIPPAKITSLIAESNNIYVMAGSQYYRHPLFENNQYHFIDTFRIKYQILAREADLTHHARTLENELKIDFVRDELANLPPKNIDRADYGFYIFQVERIEFN